MKLNEAIKKADELRDNFLSEEMKAEWLIRLDAKIAERIGEEMPVYNWPEEDPELLMPFPQDDMYVYFLTAMIDYYNQDSTTFQNDREIANAAIDEAGAWWIRNHRPKGKADYWRVM